MRRDRTLVEWSLDGGYPGAQVCLLLSELVHSSSGNIGQNELEKPQAHTSPTAELAALRKRMAEAFTKVRANQSRLTIRALNHLFRCAATLISAPKVGTPSIPRLQRSLRMAFSELRTDEASRCAALRSLYPGCDRRGGRRLDVDHFRKAGMRV